MIRIRHDDGSVVTRNYSLLCDVIWTLTLRKKRLKRANESLVVVRFCFLSLQAAWPPRCFENGGMA